METAFVSDIHRSAATWRASHAPATVVPAARTLVGPPEGGSGLGNAIAVIITLLFLGYVFFTFFLIWLGNFLVRLPALQRRFRHSTLGRVWKWLWSDVGRPVDLEVVRRSKNIAPWGDAEARAARRREAEAEAQRALDARRAAAARRREEVVFHASSKVTAKAAPRPTTPAATSIVLPRAARMTRRASGETAAGDVARNTGVVQPEDWNVPNSYFPPREEAVPASSEDDGLWTYLDTTSIAPNTEETDARVADDLPEDTEQPYNEHSTVAASAVGDTGQWSAGRMVAADCSICFDAEITHIILPCCHACTCGGCAIQIQAGGQCPMCRGTIHSMHKIMFA